MRRLLKNVLKLLFVGIIFCTFSLILNWDLLFSESLSSSSSSSSFFSFSSTNNNNNPNKPLVIVRLKNEKPIVIIGYCCDNETESMVCAPQSFVVALSQGTFPKHEIIYQQCTKHGWPPYWTMNYTNHSLPLKYRYSNSNSNSNSNEKLKNKKNIWLKPNIYFCQGYFYHKELVDTRRNANSSLQLSMTPYLRQWAELHHIRHKYLSHIYLHSKQRSFLTTYNSEPWGDDGRCGERYDVIMDSNIYRDWDKCPSIYIPPSFWFEHQRVLNNTDQLIHPFYPKQSNAIFERKKNEYLDRIIAQKKEFALFLVRDCFISYYRQDTLVRVVFYLLLSQHYKSVTSLGGCKRNKEKHSALGLNYCPKNAINGWFIGKKYNCAGYGYTDGVVQMLYPYKFFLAMENSRRPGYSTEKIMNAFYAHSIPIYFGDEEINRYINPKAFIHCKISDSRLDQLLQLNSSLAYNKLEKQAMDIVKDELLPCVELVKAVDTNITLYREMLSEPVFINNHWKNTPIDPYVIGKTLRNVLRLHNSHLITDLYNDDLL